MPARPTFGEAVARDLEIKAKKRSWKDDRRNLDRLRDTFGANRPQVEITAGRIAEYKMQRARTLVQRDGERREISAATLDRELAALRHLFTLAAEEREVLGRRPWWTSPSMAAATRISRRVTCAPRSRRRLRIRRPWPPRLAQNQQQGDKIEPASDVSVRKAGVAQWQSN